MGSIDIIEPLCTILSSAINKSQQHQEKNSWKRRESNPGLLVEKQVCQPLCYADPCPVTCSVCPIKSMGVGFYLPLQLHSFWWNSIPINSALMTISSLELEHILIQGRARRLMALCKSTASCRFVRDPRFESQHWKVLSTNCKLNRKKTKIKKKRPGMPHLLKKSTASLGPCWQLWWQWSTRVH